MLNIGALFATLSMDTGNYTRGILSAQALNQAFGQSFAQFIANPIAGGINLAKQFARSAFNAAKETTGWGESMERLGQRTGVTLATLQALEAAAKSAGLGGTAAGLGMEFFANKLGEVKVNGAAAQELFSRIGVDLSGVANTEDALRLALDAIAALPTEAERAAAAADLFGRAAGPALVNAIGGGSDALDDLIARYQKMGLVLSNETIVMLSQTGDVLDEITRAIEGLKRTAVAEFFRGLGVDGANAAESVADIANSIRQEMVPALREAGEASRTITDFFRLAREISSTIESIPVLGLGAQLQRGAQIRLGIAPDRESRRAVWEVEDAASEWRFSTGSRRDSQRRAEERRAGI